MDKGLYIAATEKHGLTVETVTGPFPRVVDEWRGIGYSVRVNVRGREMLVTDYSLGIGHVSLKPADARRAEGTMTSGERIMLRSWSDKPRAAFADKDEQLAVAVKLAKAQNIKPDPVDVMASLLLDARAIDAADFADWCTDLGYDSDSRKAEKTYMHCIGTATKLRAYLGAAAVDDLNVVFADY